MPHIFPLFSLKHPLHESLGGLALTVRGSVEYKCEICGNASYMGRRAFERHFQDVRLRCFASGSLSVPVFFLFFFLFVCLFSNAMQWRHTHGMRCLGIPNTIHFQDITKINDAVARTCFLHQKSVAANRRVGWEKVQNEDGKEDFKPDDEEEFEDPEGRVMNKKTYDMLRAQGILND